MARVVVLALAIAVTAACWSSAPEPRPNFSGHWVLEKTASRLEALDIAKFDRGVVDIDHLGTTFKFRRTFTVAGQDNSFAYELSTDGAEVTTQAGAQTRRSRLYWIGDGLVYFTRITAPEGESTNTVRYRLRSGGRVLVADEVRRGVENYHNVWVFNRERPSPAGRAAP